MAHRKNIDKRVLYEADCIINNGYTVRECAKQSGVCKTTVGSDMGDPLLNLDEEKYNQVRIVFGQHRLGIGVPKRRPYKRKIRGMY
jgi:hypothetical protein